MNIVRPQTKPIDDYLNEPLEETDFRRIGVTLSPIHPKSDVEEKIKEIIEKSTEITITYRNELIDTWREGMLKDITEKVLRRALNRCPSSLKIILIGEHSSVGRFHYHGIFYGIPNDKIAKLKRACSRHLGRTEIKQITYTESYAKYMMKAYQSLAEYPEEWQHHSYITINT